MSRGGWLAKAQELLELLPTAPDDAGPEEENLEWWLHFQLYLAVSAAGVKPAGVKARVSSKWPRIIGERPVTEWCTQADLASAFDVSERTIQRWEKIGLPAFGRGPSKRYPLPHARTWCHWHERLRGLGRRVVQLPIGTVLAEDHALVTRRCDGSIKTQDS